MPCVAGPKRPQDKLILSEVAQNFRELSLSINHNIILKNEEFYIRPFTESDAEPLHKVHKDAKIVELLGIISIERTREWLDIIVKHQHNYGYSQWAVFSSVNDEFLGKAGILNIADDGRDAPSSNDEYKNQVEASCFLLEEFASLQEIILHTLRAYELMFR